MQIFSFSDLKTKLGNDCDVTDEVFINDTELVGYVNDAIDDAETAIHQLGIEDKYFLYSATFSWVNGTNEYVLPSDIYGTKIRQIFYQNGQTKYEVTRLKNLTEIPFIESGDYYRYILVADPTAASTPGQRARFYPTPTETSTNATIWYIRNMRRMTTSTGATNTCEVPECINFITQHVKKSIAKKSRNPELIAQEDKDLIVQYNLMLEALANVVPDENNRLALDIGHYADQGLMEIYR